MLIVYEDLDTLKSKQRSYDGVTSAFWSQFAGKKIWVRDGESDVSIPTMEELVKYAEDKNRKGVETLNIRYRAKPKELDWSDYAAPKKITVAVYAPAKPVEKDNVTDLVADLSNKIAAAARKNADIFVAPEYQFTKHLEGGPKKEKGPEAISKEEHERVAEELVEISRRHPDMFIVAGTSLSVTDDNKLKNTAFILHGGGLQQYVKATIPRGDSTLRSALERHDPHRHFRDEASMEPSLSLGEQPYYETRIEGGKYTVAICSDISVAGRNGKEADIELVPASGLGLITAKTHHVHQGGHVLIADRHGGPFHFPGTEVEQSRLERDEDGIAIQTVDVRKRLERNRDQVTDLDQARGSSIISPRRESSLPEKSSNSQPQPPLGLPTEQDWKRSTFKTFSLRSRNLRRLDSALGRFHDTKGKEKEKFTAVKDAFDSWVKAHDKKPTRRDKSAVDDLSRRIEDYRAHLNGEPARPPSVAQHQPDSSGAFSPPGKSGPKIS